MEVEEDDDIYAPDDAVEPLGPEIPPSTSAKKGGDDLEEGEEEGEEVEEEFSDSDIDIITDRKEDASKADNLPSQPVNFSKRSPVQIVSSETIEKRHPSPVPKTDETANQTPPSIVVSYPAIKTSAIDVDARPIYEPNGKPITEVDLDQDFSEDDKPWRRPGTDMTDYFNYGFDEFTWASYCLKQDSLRKEVSDSKKQMEEMQSFLSMPGSMPVLPGMPGQPGGAQAGLAAMGAPGDLPQEMQQMLAQMMSQGVDISQVDPTLFMQQMMQGVQAGANGAQGQNFGGGQSFGQQGQNQQQPGFGYGGGAGGSSGVGAAGAGAGAGAGGARNQSGRGQGRRNW